MTFDPGTDTCPTNAGLDSAPAARSDVDADLARCMADVFERRGSDLHLAVGRAPMIRIDGHLVEQSEHAELDLGSLERMLRSLLDEAGWQAFLDRRQADFSVTLPEVGRFRVNAYHQLGSIAVAMRAISAVIPSTAEVGLPSDVEQVSRFPYGLVLFVGPTGSGKSTTQAALIGSINATRQCHILTIEDPVEYVHGIGTALMSQREVGSDVHSFADGLRAALREDPDIVLLGEMRDEESIAIALTLAETGHLVFATLHTNDAVQAVDRIVDSYPSDRRSQIQTQMAGALQAVVSQRLVPRIGGGRTAAFEVIIANDAIRNLIREGRTRQMRNVVSTGRADGMRTLEQSLSTLVADGVVSHRDAVNVSQYPNEIHNPSVAEASPAAPLQRR